MPRSAARSVLFGLMGDVSVFPSNSRIVNAGDLGPEAVVIATTMPTTTPPNSPTIFHYPKGPRC